MKCMTVNCQAQALLPSKTYKGLCMKCYSVAKKMVQDGETTWEELSRMGLVEEVSPFRVAYLEKKEQS